ncbi:acyltransferase [Mesobacillus boroniphilus]|uniref:Acyltransferase n=1 Tax=Mesobacillus boroniphilus TaxID=308892 RepID=A0A944CKX7_9BACI|nr:acyltransferase [Mesobacillus boroniphilus]
MVFVRRNDLDWMRVIATYMVFLYHCSMFFNPFPWHIKNEMINSSYILVFSLVVGTWIMPIFFVLSGISTKYAIRKRTGKEFLKERFIQLGVPLIFGIFILSPPQVYIERVSHQQFSGTFLSFLPAYFDGLYLEIGGTGNFAFVGLHLWYLLVLLVFSALTLPLISRIKIKKDSFHLVHYLLILLVLILITHFFNFVSLGGWGIPYYLASFVIGFFYFSNDSFNKFLTKHWITISVLAVIMSAIYTKWFIIGMPEQAGGLSFLFTTVKVLSSFNSVLLFFYLANKYFQRKNDFLNFNTMFSMPMYILHQPVIVLLGFLIYQYDWPIAIKLLVLISLSFFIIILSYQLFIKRIPVLRFLFGMKVKPAINTDIHPVMKG